MSTSPAFPTPRIPSIVPLLDPLVRRLLGVGMPMGPNVLLTIRGRQSGLPRTVPVALLEHRGRRFVQSPFGETQWTRNLRAAGEAVISRGGRREPVDAAELAPEIAGPILADAFAPYLASRFGAAFLGRFYRLRAGSPVEAFVDEARTHPVFELRARAGHAADGPST